MHIACQTKPLTFQAVTTTPLPKKARISNTPTPKCQKTLHPHPTPLAVPYAFCLFSFACSDTSGGGIEVMLDNGGDLTTSGSSRRGGVKDSWIIHGSLLGATWRLALPMIGTALLHDLFSITDMIFVGRLGKEAIAAVTLSGIIMGFLHMLALGITTGCTTLIAHAVGANNHRRAEMVASQSLLMAAVLSVITAAVFPLAALGLKLLGASPEVIAVGTPYLQITLVGSFTMYMSVACAASLRGAGDAVTPMKLIGLGNIINVVLDPILIFGWFGVPALGVAGSAWASVAARLLATVLLMKVFFTDGHKHFHLHPRDIKPHGKTLWQMFKIGVFGSGQMLMRNISALALIRIIAIFGTIPQAAFGISFRLMIAVMMPGMGLGLAATTMVGQNLGAGKMGRATRAAWLAAGIYAGLAIVVGIIFLLLAEPLIAVFSNESEIIATGAEFLRWMGATFFFVAFSMVLGRAMNGAGDTFWPMLITAVAMLGIRIPMAYGFATAWQSVTGVWFAYAASNVAQGILFILVFLWGRWKIIGRKHAGQAIEETSEIDY